MQLLHVAGHAQLESWEGWYLVDEGGLGAGAEGHVVHNAGVCDQGPPGLEQLDDVSVCILHMPALELGDLFGVAAICVHRAGNGVIFAQDACKQAQNQCSLPGFRGI